MSKLLKFLGLMVVSSWLVVATGAWGMEERSSGHPRYSLSQEEDCDSAPFYEYNGSLYVYIPTVRLEGNDYYLHLAYLDGNPVNEYYYFYTYDSWFGPQTKGCGGGYSEFVSDDSGTYLYIPSFLYDGALYTIWLAYMGTDDSDASKHWFYLYSMKPR
ncbi:hypothetical protein CCP4SC76_750004 [Gammaproteobacteria bacterium]